MNNEQSLNHTKQECKYHLTWVPKYHKKTLHGDLRNHPDEEFVRVDCRLELCWVVVVQLHYGVSPFSCCLLDDVVGIR